MFIINGKRDILESLITIFILIAVFSIYYALEKNKFRKYGNSPVNKKIDSIYSKWYRTSANLLNRKNTTIYEINKLLFSLKNELMDIGISENDIKSYIEMLKSYKDSFQFGFKDVLIAILSFNPTNSLVIDYVNNNQNNVFNVIEKYLSNPENANQAINALIILLAIAVFCAIVWTIIKIATLDTIHKKSQRLFVLNGLLGMWHYKENREIEEISDFKQLEPRTVYVNLKFRKSKTEEFISASIGESPEKIFFYIWDRIVTKIYNLNDKAIGFIQLIFAIFVPSIVGLLLYVPTCFLFLILSGDIRLSVVGALIALVILLIIIGFLLMLYFAVFKSAFENYKSLPTTGVNDKKMSRANTFQIISPVIFYFFVSYRLSNIRSILFFSVLIPLSAILLSVFLNIKSNDAP